MTDYMKEAERLLEQYDDACLGIIGMSEEQARAALLAHIQRGGVLDKPARVGNGIFGAGLPTRYVIEAAQRLYEAEAERGPRTLEQIHEDERVRRKTWEMFNGPLTGSEDIQRGAVPEGWKLVPVRLPMETEMRPVIARLARAAESGQVILFDDFWSELLAAAPDQFRDDAKMAPVHCTPTEHEGRIVYEHTSEPIPNADGFVLYAASADQFRTAAKMMAEPAGDRIAAAIHYPECWDTAAYPTAESALAEVLAHYRCTEHDTPAEVPMPEPIGFIDSDDDETWATLTQNAHELATLKLRSAVFHVSQMRTYGAACRAVGEAAGYARGVADERERCASVAWAHYMDTCRRKGIGPDVLPDWCCAAALRGEVKP